METTKLMESENPTVNFSAQLNVKKNKQGSINFDKSERKGSRWTKTNHILLDVVVQHNKTNISLAMRQKEDDDGRKTKRKREETITAKKKRKTHDFEHLIPEIDKSKVLLNRCISKLGMDLLMDEIDEDKILVRKKQLLPYCKAYWQSKYGENTLFIDLTLKGKFSCFHPSAPVKLFVPFTERMITAASVREIFDSMKIIREGEIIGWRKGTKINAVVPLSEARWVFFIDVYKDALDKHKKEIDQLKDLISHASKVLFLDDCVNVDVDNFADVTELSHAYLLKCYLEGCYPTRTE